MRPLLRHLPLLLVLATAAMGGCLDDAGVDDAGTDIGPRPPASNPDVKDPGPGAAATHGDPRIEASSVTAEVGNDGRWHARKTVTIRNDFGGASAAHVSMSFSAGNVAVVPDSNGGYEYVMVLDVTGATEQEAREGMDDVVLDHQDRLQQGRLVLATSVALEPVPSPVPGVTVGSLFTRQLRVEWQAHLAPQAAYALDVDTSSADVTVSDLAGEKIAIDTSSGDITVTRPGVARLDLDASSGDIVVASTKADQADLGTSSGDVSLQGKVGRITVDTSSGDVALDGTFNDLDVGTSSGDVNAKATPGQTGDYAIDTSSGSVSLHLGTGSAFGYDVQAGTSSGDIDIDIEEGEVVSESEDEMHVRTAGFSDRSIRTAIDIDTSSGDINVSG